MEYKLANVHPEAKIGKNVVIEPFATVEKDVVIGDNCWIGSGAIVKQYSTIGEGCRIFHGAVIGSIPQDLKFKGEYTTVEIGNNTTIREYATVNRGTASKGTTKVGDNCLLMSYSHIGHDCVIKNNIIIGNTSQIAGEVVIEDWAILSAGVLVHQFSHLGGHIMIQGNNGVTKDVPPFVTAGRDPLAYVGLNLVGMRRRGFSEERIQNIHNIYRELYQGTRNTTQAVAFIKETFPACEDKDTIINFIESSERGIIPSYFKHK